MAKKMKWQEIYTKYKDTELMKEFEYIGFAQEDELLPILDIKDIWGYLICFAETKGWYIELNYILGSKVWFCVLSQGCNDMEDCEEVIEKKTIEETMVLSADKFFEVAK